MHKGGGYGHHAFDGDHHAAVVADTDKLALDAGKHAAGDADTGALAEVQLGGLEIEQRLFVVLGDGDEVAHLHVGDDERTVVLPIHDVADGEGGALHIFDGVNAGTGTAHKHQVVHSRHELADTALVFYDVFVAHRDEALDVFAVEVGFQSKFTAVSDTQGVPV